MVKMLRCMRFLRTMTMVLAGFVMLASTASALTLLNVSSRKTHGTAGTYDLPINASGAFNNFLSIEPRAIGAAHLIVFTFDETLTAPGTVAVVDANGTTIGSASLPAMAGSEVRVSLADVPDRRSIKVTLTGVTGASGSTDASATLGFLIGSFNDSPLVSMQDARACRARSGMAADLSSFRYDVSVSGLVSAADVAVAKTHVGLSLVTGALPMAWGRGGWDLDVWQ